jgi:hypothetical protein
MVGWCRVAGVRTLHPPILVEPSASISGRKEGESIKPPTWKKEIKVIYPRHSSMKLGEENIPFFSLFVYI